MNRRNQNARRLDGSPGESDAKSIGFLNHIVDPVHQAYAFNAIDHWPDEAFDLLRRCGLPIELALEAIPAALLVHAINEGSHGLSGDDMAEAEQFWLYVMLFMPRDWSDARHWLIVALRSRVRQWLPVLLEHFAAELRRSPSKVASIQDSLLAILALLGLYNGKGVAA